MEVKLDYSVSRLKGVGESLAAKLARLNIYTVEDLLNHYPRRYEDFSKITSIRQMRPGPVTIKGTVQRIASRRARFKRLSITEAIIADTTGTVKAIWFNQPYLPQSIPAGSEVYVSGRLEFKNNDLAIQSPAIEPVDSDSKHTARIVPVYPETEGLTSKQLRGLIWPLLPLAADLSETLPESVLSEAKLLPRSQAVIAIHFPPSSLKLAAARRRLAFEELFFLMLTSLVIKHEIKTEIAPAIVLQAEVAKKFIANLGFDFTDAQRRAAWEILKDMAGEQPMNRLLEGDVGSGKTVVAALAAVMAADSGYQTALMAPTDLLARQHFANLAPLLEAMGFHVTLVVGGQPAVERKKSSEMASCGQASLIVGTQALLSTNLSFSNLGLVIIDEQHRFGVNQRQSLKAKAGHLPHLLSLTATPIPRSLALTVYGDLDISIIDSLPPGRTPINTTVAKAKDRQKIYSQIDNQIEAGRQVFVVCPLIEPSDVLGFKSATAEFDRLKSKVFKHRRIGLLHGKLSAAEKNLVMQEFANGQLDLMVSTNVIEVGIDVPNATIMLIEGADRFGLAALHQLRGRVGRGQHQSYCYLFSDSPQLAAIERLSALEKTNDGFRLAQIDLELRGPGQIYGSKQHGILDLQFADIADVKLLAAVRSAASAFLQQPSAMVEYPHILQRINALKSVTSLD